MIIGGPNNRKDFHEQDGEEWFYMVKGDMNLKIFADGAVHDVLIKEGDMYMLPAHTPHSPQRFADTVGVVIERKRMPGEIDHLRWYCDACSAVVYEESFFCTDLGSQLKPVIERYVSTESLRVCKACGHPNTPFTATAPLPASTSPLDS